MTLLVFRLLLYSSIIILLVVVLQVDESSGRSLTHHSEAHEFLGEQDRRTHQGCQPLESPVCLEVSLN